MLPLAELYFDFRSLSTESSALSSWHYNCVVIDRESALITYARLITSAQQRNIDTAVEVNYKSLVIRLQNYSKQLRKYDYTVKQSETILAFLTSASGPICDDCLSARTSITPRQAINQNCNRMAKANQIVRGESMTCYYCRSVKICNVLPQSTVVSAKPPSPIAKTNDPHKLWYWEGNIQNRLVTWLEQEDWMIQSAADTAAKTAGKDIIAEYNERTLWISVKGYPRGTQKTNPPTQARHWFSHAVFDLVRYRDESDSTELALGMPDGFVTYKNLSERVKWLRSHLPFSIYWVSESGEIRMQ